MVGGRFFKNLFIHIDEYKSNVFFKYAYMSMMQPQNYTTVKVPADWATDSASDSASDWAADWASDPTHFNCSKVHFVKHYFQSFLGCFSLQISVDLSNTTYLFIAKRKLRKNARL